jgi:hypothetical protein
MTDNNQEDGRDVRTNSTQHTLAVNAMAEAANRITDDLKQLLGDRPDAMRAVLLKAVVNVIVQEHVDDRSKGLRDLADEFGRELVDLAAQIEEKVAS